MTMSATGHASPVQPAPAPVVRILGWVNLALMGAFLLNAVLTFVFGWPGDDYLIHGQNEGALKWVQLALYAVALAGAVAYALGSVRRPLRREAALVNEMNMVFIRAMFWAVFLVGLADIAISFVRVEGFLEQMIGNHWAVELGRSNFRGIYVHTPLVIAGCVIAAFARTPGFYWLTLLVVAAELLIVFSRFIFSYEQAFMADLVRFWYAAMFLFASGYTLLEDGHVRVDVFYAGMARRTQGRVNAVGAILLGITLCWVVLLIGMSSRTSIIVSPITVFEVTQAGFGMYVKYMMAAFLGVFAVSMNIQFVSQLFDSVADARDEPGGHEDHHASHIA